MSNEGTAYNRAYLASVLRTYAQIPLRGTSDTLGTLDEIVARSEFKHNSLLTTINEQRLNYYGSGAISNQYTHITYR